MGTMTTPTDPFDLDGLEWVHVSPGLVRARLIVLAIWLLTPAVAFALVAVLADVVWPWIPAGAFALLFAWTCWLVPRQVRALRYAEREDDLLVRRGIMFRSLVVVPYGRMQYVDVSAGPVDRSCGIAKVQLHTAASATDATIAGLPPAEAARLRDRLASRGEARLAGL
jgi:membrane protein YdbS with pleckstrin-like domain